MNRIRTRADSLPLLRTLRGRLALVVSGAVLALLVPSIVLLGRMEDRSLRAEVLGRQQAQAAILASSVASPADALDLPLRPNPGLRGRVWLADARGRQLPPPTVSVSPQPATDRLAAALERDASGHFTYSVNGTARLAGFARIPGLEWTVVTEEHEIEALRPARNRRGLLVLLLGAGTVVAAFGATVVAGRFTQPLRTLTEAARALAAGEAAPPLSPRGTTELRTLTAAFAEMRERLADRNADLEAARARLEKEVAYRTAALRRELEERQQAEELARQSERTLRTILQHLPTGVWYADGSGKIAYGNPEARRIWAGARYTGPEGYGEYVAWWWGTDRRIAADEWALHRAFRSKRGVLNELIEIEGFDGTRRAILNSVVPVLSDDEKVLGAVVINQDVTDLQRVRTELDAARAVAERNLAQLEAVLGSLMDAVILVDARGRILDQNPASVSLHGLDESGDLPLTITGMEDRLEYRNPDGSPLPPGATPLARAARGERYEPQELRVRVRQTGREILGSYSATPVLGREGTTGLSVVTIRDMTERGELLAAERAARTEAERANALKDQFLATLSHELRTPLSAVLGWAQLLRGGRLSEQDAAEAMEIIERNAVVQQRLIDDLLDVSRILSGKLELAPQIIDANEIVRTACEAALPSCTASGLHLECVTGDAPLTLRGDAGRLNQVLGNLLSNAGKFTPSGGRITVRSTSADGWTRIEVADTGAGVAPEFLPYIFDRFRRADLPTARRRGGLGLGLSIVQQIVELHGGRVEATSGGPGKGSTFTVWIPAVDSAPGAQAVPELSGGALQPVSLDGVRVLVVEDEPAMRAYLRRVLADSGAEVVAAESAADAMAAARRVQPEVLVSDIGLPDEDGYTLLRRLRAGEEGVGAPAAAVAVTAYAFEEDLLRARSAGFDAHLSKPVESGRLIATVAALVRASRARPTGR